MLPALLIAYAAAGLAHHAHNAAFLGEYPNLPAWLTAAHIYAAWLGMTAVGALGYVVFARGRDAIGLALMAAYALYGLGALAHYAAAPLSAHGATMHATIWLEAAAAALLLAQLSRRHA